MIIRKLNNRQKDLLYALYEHTVTLRETPGMFRQIYEDGGSQRRWGVDETLKLEKLGLIKLAQDMLPAGIICQSLTKSGRRYVEAFA